MARRHRGRLMAAVIRCWRALPEVVFKQVMGVPSLTSDRLLTSPLLSGRGFFCSVLSRPERLFIGRLFDFQPPHNFGCEVVRSAEFAPAAALSPKIASTAAAAYRRPG